MPLSAKPGPIILAIETATSCGSVALVSRETCLAEYSLNSPSTHSRLLPKQINQLFGDLDLAMDQLAAIAVSVGPGSFTGLRIGLSTAKGLAFAGEIPLIGIPAMDGLARQAGGFPNHQICVVLDARKKEIYSAFYKTDARGGLNRISENMVMKPESLAALISEPTVLIGDGATLHRQVMENGIGTGALFLGGAEFFPRASTIGSLAIERYLAGDIPPWDDLVPLYVRASEAEINAGIFFS